MSLTLTVNFNFIDIYIMTAQWRKPLRFMLTVLVFDVVMTIVYLYFAYDSKEWDGFKSSHDQGLINKIVNRFYYSVNVSTAFGLGPVSPRSNLLKLINVTAQSQLD